jgi:hypothetical protein
MYSIGSGAGTRGDGTAEGVGLTEEEVVEEVIVTDG